MNIVSWNGYNINDGEVYETCVASLMFDNPRLQANMVERHGRYPLVGGVSRPDETLILRTIIRSATPIAARAALRTIFETEGGTIKTLIVNGDDGTEQYIQAVCEAHFEFDDFGQAFHSILRIHDDTSWRSTAVETDTESVTATGQQWQITNEGDQIARPTITITPTDTQPNTNAYRRFVAVRWRGDGAADYPTDIVNNAWDSAALVSGGKLQADGDDLRVLVNGGFADYWLDDINTDNTSIWLNLDWQTAVPMTLAADVAASGTVETIDVNESIANMPPQGILLIDSELFLFTAKNDALRRFTIDARAAHATSEAAHTADTAVYWIQYSIEIQYGNATLSAYVNSGTKEPIIELASSSNTSWVYADFGSNPEASGVEYTGQWLKTGQYYFTVGGYWVYTWYNESQFPNGPGGSPDSTDPWEVIGLYEHILNNISTANQRWYRHCPCGVTAANFQNGYKYALTGQANWRGRIRSRTNGGGWITEYSIPVPTLANTWQTWSQNETTLQSNARYISLELDKIQVGDGGTRWHVEASDVTLTFDTNLTPTTYLAPERGNYTIEATLTHVESGLALQITFATTLDNSLVINTATGEITDLSDGSSQFQAVRRLPRPRVEWLPLLPGTNTLQWDEADVVGVDVTFDWRERRGA